MNVYSKLCERAAELYWDALKGDALAIEIGNLMSSVTSEGYDYKTLNLDNDADVLAYIEFVADGIGLSVSDILGD